jgi:hypothetical protein
MELLQPAEALGTFAFEPKIFRSGVRKAFINGVKLRNVGVEKIV